MKININLKQNSHGFQIIDALYAYLQSFSDKYKFDFADVCITNEFDTDADINIFCDYMPTELNDSIFLEYDYVFFNNACEPLTVATEFMKKKLLEYDNCYFISNSLLTEKHWLYNKVIWWPANVMDCKRLWTDHFYPHFFDNHRRMGKDRSKNLIYINGRNDSNRHDVLEYIKHNTSVPALSNISTYISEVKDSFFETVEDTEFRDYINCKYENNVVRKQKSNYLDEENQIHAGINGKFGQYPPGYLIMDEYFDTKCVIFPESTWQNDECAITEKSCKCWLSGSLPWPIGGSNLNALYNEIGFQTAWNLLPDNLQEYDSEKNHHKRYLKLYQAISWLENNIHVLDSDEYHQMIVQNRNNFLLCVQDIHAITKLEKLKKAFI